MVFVISNPILIDTTPFLTRSRVLLVASLSVNPVARIYVNWIGLTRWFYLIASNDTTKAVHFAH